MSNSKRKTLYIMRILLDYTNQDYPMTSTQIIDELKKFGISAERKSVYEVIDNLSFFGLDIKQSKVKPKGFYVASREFDIPELKLLVDAVQSSKFITEKKSIELISKIKTLTDNHSAAALQREVYIANRVKSSNEKIYYNIDKIHQAIAEHRKISFQYCEYSLKKRLVTRKDGKEYVYSPYALIWEDEYYYLVVYDDRHDSYVHFRTDKMKNITIMNEGAVYPDSPLDIGSYAKHVFSMFGGDIVPVTIEAVHSLVGVFIDKFGKDIVIIQNENTFHTTINVVVSSAFLSWLYQFGKDVQVINPPDVVEKIRNQITELNLLYGK